jgi:cytochrome c553
MKLTALALALVSTTAYAGDPAAGKTKSLACQTCHVAANGPHLVGQREAYVVEQLTAFKSGDRKNDFMTPIAKQLSEADIADLAAYWSAQAAGTDATIPAAVAAIKKPRMAFPKNFPAGFSVYRSEADAVHHTTSKSYANAIAVAAAKAHKPLPAGSAIIVENDGADGKPTAYSGMEAHAGWGKDIPALLENGDWSYNLWTADRSPKPDVNQAVCLACHKPAAATSYVFTLDKIK